MPLLRDVLIQRAQVVTRLGSHIYGMSTDSGPQRQNCISQWPAQLQASICSCRSVAFPPRLLSSTPLRPGGFGGY
ncbi:hypothetical protein VTI28DRAFT_4672 [Corynascus sepedonium]